MTLKTANQRLGTDGAKTEICDEGNSQSGCVDVLRIKRKKKKGKDNQLFPNGQEYKSHIGELKGVGAETTVPIIQ